MAQKLATFAAIEQQRAKLQKLEGLCAALERDLPESLGLPALPSLASLNSAIDNAGALVRTTCTANDTAFEPDAVASPEAAAAAGAAANGDSARAAPDAADRATESVGDGTQASNTESEPASASGTQSDAACAAAATSSTSESDAMRPLAPEGDSPVQQLGESITSLVLEPVSTGVPAESEAAESVPPQTSTDDH